MAEPGAGTTTYRPGLGIALIVLTVFIFAAMDAIIRSLKGELPVSFQVGLRFAVQAGTVFAAILFMHGQSFRSRKPGFQFLRGVLLLAVSCLNFLALQYLPLPEFTSIMMLTPLIVSAAAAIWLREQLSTFGWLLVLGGFVGVLIMMRPGAGIFGLAALLPLASATVNTAYQLLTRRMAGSESIFATHFWTGIVGMVGAAIVMHLQDLSILRIVQTASSTQLAWLLFASVLGSIGHLLLILAFRLASATQLMPFCYLQIPFAVLFSWSVFGEVPDIFGWIGIGLVILCGVLSLLPSITGLKESHPT